MNGDQYKPWWQRLPIAILISVTFAIGAYRVAVTDNGLDGVVMLTVAVVLIGVWITVELFDKFYNARGDCYLCPDPSKHSQERDKA